MALAELKGPVVLEIPADPASLFVVRAVVAKLSEKSGFKAKESDMLVLAIDEACTNVIRHAYNNSFDGRIILTFKVTPKCLEIHVRDFGKVTDPATFQSRKLEDIRPGGLGIHFMKSAVDILDYDSPPGGGTLLKMVKFRPEEEVEQN